MTITNIHPLPPLIIQSFSMDLLHIATPKLRDTLEVFDVMLHEVHKMWKKLNNNPRRRERCEAIKREIMELYERAKVKEKEREEQKDHKTQEFGYFVALSEAVDRDVYERLRFGRRSGSVSHKFKNNDAFQRIRRRGR